MLDIHMLIALDAFEAGEIDADEVLARWKSDNAWQEKRLSFWGDCHPNWSLWQDIMADFAEADHEDRLAIARDLLERSRWREEDDQTEAATARAVE